MPGPLDRIPVDFLLTCSEQSLQDLELERLNRIANLTKQKEAIETELLALESAAVVARWLLNHREQIRELCRIGALQETLDFEGRSFVKVVTHLGGPHSGVGNATNKSGHFG